MFPHNHIHKMRCTHNRSLMQIRRDWEHKRGRTQRNNGDRPWTSESTSECHSVIGWHSRCITLNSIDNTCQPLPLHASVSLLHRIAHHYNPNQNNPALIPTATEFSWCCINRYTTHIAYNNGVISIFDEFINACTLISKSYNFLSCVAHQFFFCNGLGILFRDFF